MFPRRVRPRGLRWWLSLSAALGTQDKAGGLWFTFLGEALLSLFFFFKRSFILFWLCSMAARAFSSHRQQGLLFSAFCGLLIVIASLVVEHGL